MVDIHQSAQYATFMQRIGWKTESIDTETAFIRTFPLIGSVIKIQRPNTIPRVSLLRKLKKKYRSFSVTIEPGIGIKNIEFRIKNFRKTNTSYLPTKTIHINLKPTEKELFRHFSESTRRAVRRAKKNNLIIRQSRDIDVFIALKAKQFFPLGFLFTREIKPLWETFSPKHTALLLAYSNNKTIKQAPLAGVFLLFYQRYAYYWLAVSTKEGRKLRAPTLLVWEALKHAKKRNCATFDFEGVYDERFPSRNTTWKGFTRFKKGFGGKEICYPKPYTL